ncbi:acyl-CoA thioester hydrolase/BAAT C-terminal domain-containing protein [Paenibacillus dendritiformis]|uniref:acyl-CoA thioester hydrolase/BAAT C-terminal domain-containing protein n=1 Tax=Paenibacillus dendritiformis TaxID=130049 RepID=UPI00364AA01A
MNSIIQFQRRSMLCDDPVRITVSRLQPYQRVTLRSSAKDEDGELWEAIETLAADSRGTIQYGGQSHDGDEVASGLALMKFLWSLSPTGSTRRRHSFFRTDSEPFQVQLSVHAADGERLASEYVPFRFCSEDVNILDINEPVVGRYFYPEGKSKLPAALVLTGSMGGTVWSMQTAAMLSSKGYAALSLAYMDYQGRWGLPDKFADIPLDYFSAALQWLKQRPETDETRTGIFGLSMGAQAALLLGSLHPTDMRAIIALMPSSHIFPGFSRKTVYPCSPWQSNDEPISFIPFREPAATVHDLYRKALETATAAEKQLARIRVENIRCPLLMMSTQKDAVWPSYEMCCALTETLRENSMVKHISFTDAEHVWWLPYLPPVIQHPDLEAEKVTRSNKIAWETTLDFLNNHL